MGAAWGPNKLDNGQCFPLEKTEESEKADDGKTIETNSKRRKDLLMPPLHSRVHRDQGTQG